MLEGLSRFRRGRIDLLSYFVAATLLQVKLYSYLKFGENIVAVRFLMGYGFCFYYYYLLLSFLVPLDG